MTRFKSLYQAKQTTADVAESQHFHWPAAYADGGLQEIEPEQWGLSVSGDIEKPTRFVLRNIQAMPQTVQERRWISADGWSVKAAWKGVLLEEIVKRIHPQLPADSPEDTKIWVIQENLNGAKECLPLDTLLQGQALLCHQANGQALPWLYGGPVALMVFDRYSYKGLGQISHLTFTTTPLESTCHKEKGYPEDGVILPGDYYAFDLQSFRPLHGPELWGQALS